MKIAVIGGGFTGLSASLELAQASEVKIVLFEQEKELGGLAGCFTINGELFERYHHFISVDDSHLLKAVKELGIAHEISWRETKLGYFIDGKLVPFTSPIDLLAFPTLKITDKIRFAISMAYLTRLKNWENLENASAKEWLIKTQGARTYQRIWAHLMEMKFSSETDIIPLSWLWARSKRRASNRKLTGSSEKFGVFKNSAFVMVQAILEQLHKKGAEILLNTKVNKIEEAPKGLKISSSKGEEIFDKVIFTAPLPTFLETVSPLSEEYQTKLRTIKYAGIINMVAEMDREFSPYFWLNISDSSVPFPGIIEMTHLRPTKKGCHLIYIPNYFPHDHPAFEKNNEAICADYLPALQQINPQARIINYHVFKDRYADPYYSLGYSKKLPHPKTPIKGLYLCNTAQIYPVTRSVNNSIWWGKQVASIALSDK